MPVKLIRTPDDPDRMIQVQYVPEHAGRTGRPNPVRPLGFPRHGAPRVTMPQRSFVLGADLGQSQDYTALALVERTPEGFNVPFLSRVRGLPYTRIVERIAALMALPPLAGCCKLVLDQTGCGRPVFDLMRDAGLDPCGITLVSGTKIGGGRAMLRVPKVIIIETLVVQLQLGALKISAGLEHAATLARELSEMRRRVTAAGNQQFGVWREGEHDDLTLALGIGLWYAERFPAPMLNRAPAASTPRRLVPGRTGHPLIDPDQVLERIEQRKLALGGKQVT